MKTALALTTLGVATYAGIRRYINQRRNREAQQDREIEVPIQQLIKEAYLRISTKENMSIIYDMLKLDCSQSQQILQPYSYTIKTGGKKIRLVMAVIISEMFVGRQQNGHIRKQILQIGGLIQFLHSASLIIDDIEDQSTSRRGQPCSYLVHGLGRSINAANLMYFMPFKQFISTIECPIKKMEIFSIFVDQMTISHMGQAQDVLVHKANKRQDLPIFQQYQTLTIAKTSSLLRMMARMICVMLNRPKKEAEKLCEVMNYIGLAFQVTDDILNLTKNLGKGEIAEDLRQKKFTPIIHFMRDNQQFIRMFLQIDKSSQDIEKMLQMILNSQAVEAAKDIASKYQQKAELLLKNMETPFPKIKFQKLMKFIIAREN